MRPLNSVIGTTAWPLIAFETVVNRINVLLGALMFWAAMGADQKSKTYRGSFRMVLRDTRQGEVEMSPADMIPAYAGGALVQAGIVSALVIIVPIFETSRSWRIVGWVVVSHSIAVAAAYAISGISERNARFQVSRTWPGYIVLVVSTLLVFVPVLL